MPFAFFRKSFVVTVARCTACLRKTASKSTWKVTSPAARPCGTGVCDQVRISPPNYNLGQSQWPV